MNANDLIRPGQLVKCPFVYYDNPLNHKLAVYLGKTYIHRDDGATVKNHQVLVIGHSKPTTIPHGYFKSLTSWSEK